VVLRLRSSSQTPASTASRARETKIKGMGGTSSGVPFTFARCGASLSRLGGRPALPGRKPAVLRVWAVLPVGADYGHAVHRASCRRASVCP
jgi:hypothetical protein